MPTASDQRIMISFQVPEKLLTKLREKCQELDVPRACLLRRALRNEIGDERKN